MQLTLNDNEDLDNTIEKWNPTCLEDNNKKIDSIKSQRKLIVRKKKIESQTTNDLIRDKNTWLKISKEACSD